MKPIQILLENRLIYFGLIILIGLFFSLYQINIEDLWYDEIASFWVVDPNISFKETYSRLLSSENTPLLYYIIVKFFFNFFGYNPDLLRVINIPIFIISLIYFNLILSKVSKNSIFFLLASLLFTFNSFLISYAQEGRVFILFCMLSLMLINQYILSNQSFKKEKNIKFQYFIFFLLTFVILNTFIFSFLILGSIFFYEIIFKKNKINYFVLLIILFSIILFTLLNYQFLLNLIKFESVIQQPNYNFYYNFYFKQFFGSKIMGLFFLTFFTWSIFNYLKQNEKNKNITLIYIIIFFSYFVPIIYGMLFKPIIQDKYIIYLVPLIIIIVAYSITHHFKAMTSNVFVIFFILISFSNQLLKNYKSEIDKPMFKAALFKAIEINGPKFIYTSYADNKNDFSNLQLFNYINQIEILKNKNFNVVKKVDKMDFFLICYDPSNTYNLCLKNTNLYFSNHYLKKEYKFYQVILFHYVQN